MNINELDKNFTLQTVKEEDVEWHNVDEAEFSLYGLMFDASEDIFVRMPRSVSKRISDGVHHLARMSSGGRVRFSTDSPYVAIRCEEIPFWPTNNMSTAATHGFSIYTDNMYRGMYSPDQMYIYKAIEKKAHSFEFDAIRKNLDTKMKECALFFPLFGGVRRLYVGIKKGSVLQKAKEYKNKKPIVFYGSSITHGACASHAGNDYVGMLSRKLNFDYVNLGFSGNAKGEPEMAEYLASLDALALVVEYDYNALSAEELREKHLPFYEILRRGNKNVPILFLSKPDFEYDSESAERRDIVKATYLSARERGDKNIYFVDGEALFGRKWRDCCTQDTCHPNDLGSYRVAKRIEPILKNFLRRNEV